MEQMEIRHYLTFEFPGMQGKFVYIVSEDVKNSVRHEFLQRDREIEGPVIEFEDTSGRKIAVNLDMSVGAKRFSTPVFIR
jgi:hypothetical protein